MFSKNEQFAVEAQKTIDTAMELVSASIHGVEQLTHIQLEASRQILSETSQAVKDLATLTDAKQIFERVSAIAAQAVEKNMASARNAYEVINEVQAKISKVAEERVQSMQQAALNSVDGLSKFNPNGTNFASDALKNWINTTNQAVAAMSKVATQVTEFTNSNLNAATSATFNAVKKVAKK